MALAFFSDLRQSVRLVSSVICVSNTTQAFTFNVSFNMSFKIGPVNL